MKKKITSYQVVMSGCDDEGEDVFKNLGVYTNLKDAKQIIVKRVNKMRVPRSDYDSKEDYKEDLEELGITIKDVSASGFEDCETDFYNLFYHILKNTIEIEI